MTSARTPITLLAFALVSGCASSGADRLLPGYEVLSVPQSAARYTVGAAWSPAIGAPDASLPAVTATASTPGVERLDSSRTASAGLLFETQLAGWIAGTLGLEASESASVQLEGLEHHYVSALADIEARFVLLETVTAEAFELELTADRGLSAAAEAREIELGLEGASADLELSVESRAGRRFTVSADTPLVVALRTAEVAYSQVDPRISPLDLSTAARGQRQPLEFDYAVRVLAVDPVLRTVDVELEDRGHGRTTIERLTLQDAVEQISPSFDPDAERGTDYDYDTFAVEWSQQLEAGALRITRVTRRLRIVDSGLADTR